jgi:hypothetical protein
MNDLGHCFLLSDRVLWFVLPISSSFSNFPFMHMASFLRLRGYKSRALPCQRGLGPTESLLPFLHKLFRKLEGRKEILGRAESRREGGRWWIIKAQSVGQWVIFVNRGSTEIIGSVPRQTVYPLQPRAPEDACQGSSPVPLCPIQNTSHDGPQ